MIPRTMVRFSCCFIVFLYPVYSKNLSSVLQDIRTINSLQNSWKAGFTSMAFMDHAEIRKHLALKFKPTRRSGFKPLQMNFESPSSNNFQLTSIPQHFDARENWPKCSCMRNIPDQGSCGCCWALAMANAFADRVCVATNQTIDRLLSAEELLTCCSKCSDGDGCEGGYFQPAFEYIRKEGIVTGGNYNSEYGCKPYSTASCVTRRQCTGEKAKECRRQCTNPKYNKPYDKDKVYGGRMVHMGDNETLTQFYLMNVGSVVASMAMYTDFMFYKNGIYQHTSTKEDDFLGYHAVRVIGWGSQNNKDYWLAVNSWTPYWGENGLFRINRKNNECEFGDFVTSVPRM